VLALVPAQAALAASDSTATTIVTTSPSDQIGGLPSSTLDGSVAYLPQGSGALGANALTRAAATTAQAPATGYDISWPQCGGAMPPASDIAIVGVDDGHPFSQNPCLTQELAWAQGAKQQGQYMVLDSPVGWSSPHVLEYAYHGPAGDCTATEYECLSFNWGYNAANADLQYAAAQGASSDNWWLDVEVPSAGSVNPPGPTCYTANFWICDTTANSTIILAAVAVLEAHGKHVGVYSTKTQWQTITGGLPLGLPIWIAGYDYAPATYCDPQNAGTYWFALGLPRMVQSLPTTFDPDTDC
jgi:hypothetical protein